MLSKYILMLYANRMHNLLITILDVFNLVLKNVEVFPVYAIFCAVVCMNEA